MDHRRIDQLIDTGGRTLSEADRQFVTLLLHELEQFQFQAPKDRALMFHPLRGYERYLIHKVTEVYPKLTSFSIGDEKNRRTVVCFKSKRKEQQMQLGQMSPDRRPPSRGMSAKELRTPRASAKSKTLEHSPAKSRHRGPDIINKNKMDKYNTWSSDAVKRRERGLDMEGPVMNGDRDFSKSDVESGKRDPRDQRDLRKKHHTRRSRSQPHLNERPRRHRRDSLGDSTDQQYSDADVYNRKAYRPVSANNTPERRRSKPKIGRIDMEVLSHEEDDTGTHLSSSTDFSLKDFHEEHSDIENNEVPPSYEKSADTGTVSKAKRNLRRIKRTNSTRSCPPLDQPKHDYVNSTTLPMKSENHVPGYKESPVFPRKENSKPTKSAENHGTGTETRSRSHSKEKDRKKSKRSKSRESKKAARDYVNVPTEEIVRPNSYESSPFESYSVGAPEPVQNGLQEVTVDVENVLSESEVETAQPRRASSTSVVGGNQNRNEKTKKESAPLSTEIPLASDEAMLKNALNKTDKDIQTDLHGSVVDAMLSTYNAHLDAFGQLAHPGLSALPASSNLPPSSIRTSGTSTPSLSSPSTYEKLGEYMYKAMLNFQNMLIGGQQMPLPHEYRSSSGPAPFSGQQAVYAPVTQPPQPVFVPWMPPYFPDPNNSRPPAAQYQSQPAMSVDSSCCHHRHLPNGPANKGGPLCQIYNDACRDSHRTAPIRDDTSHWPKPNSHRFGGASGREPATMEHSISSHPLHSTKGPDGFESDVSSEVTNPEVTVAEGGDCLMVYVRNSSNRSTSSAAGSVVGSAHSSHGPNGDNLARASPLGHDNDDVFKKAPKSTSSIGGDSKKSSHSKESAKASNAKPKKTESKSHKKKKEPSSSPKKTKTAKRPVEEGIPALAKAPLAQMEDGEDEFDYSSSSTSSSSTSRHSSCDERISDSADAESARSLVGEDLNPLVCFDDCLEIACEEDEEAED